MSIYINFSTFYRIEFIHCVQMKRSNYCRILLFVQIIFDRDTQIATHHHNFGEIVVIIEIATHHPNFPKIVVMYCDVSDLSGKIDHNSLITF